jgi:aminoglycoside phosphotransferase (APT) family kinase protein
LDAKEVGEGLTAFIQRQAGAKAVRIEGLTRLSGGASRETWSFDAVVERDGAEEGYELIFRSDPVEDMPAAPGRELEYHSIRAAWEEGVAVPEPLWEGDATFGRRKWYVMRRVPGETLGPRLIRGEQYARARELIVPQLAQSAARIHRISGEKHPELRSLTGPEPGASPAMDQVLRFEETLKTASPDPHPVFELAFRWLRANLPEVRERRFVHGDFRLGNLIFGEDGLRAVIDWEGAHWGDPIEDLGWVCCRAWRFGGKKPVAGVGDRETFFRAYEEASGEPVDRNRARWWEVFAHLRWGVICITQAARHWTGLTPSVEFAAIGRRTTEMEWELLEILEGERS